MKAIKLFIKSLIGTLFFLIILFVCAGSINYWQGWLFVTISIICLILNSFALRNNSELVEERLTARSGTKTWDKKIIGLQAVTLIITYIIAGFDVGRFRWSPQYHWIINALGIVLIFLGEILFLTAQKQNRFFSSLMRIQTDRGHEVIDSGIYRIVRHPAYLGMILTAVSIPLVLGSLWSFIPSIFSVLLTIIRTFLEDKTLINELNGYREYSLKTQYRLLPHVW